MPSGKAWSESDDDSLKRLLEHGVDYKACAHTLNRSILAIRIRAHHLRRRPRKPSRMPSRTAPPLAPEPVQLGPNIVVELREKAILAHSFSRQTVAALEATQPISNPTPPDAVEAVLSLDYETGKLVLARVGETKRAAIRDQADNWFQWKRRRP